MSSLAYLILAVSVCVPIAVDAVPTGSVCIPAFPKTSGGELPMTQGYISPSQVSIQIGSQKPVVISKQVGNNVSGLSLKKRHLVQIKQDGKQKTSFWLDFREHTTSKLCLWWYPGYGTYSWRKASECRCP